MDAEEGVGNMTQVNSSRDYVKALILMLVHLPSMASYAKAAEDMLIPITISTDGARHLSSLFYTAKWKTLAVCR